ncbi:unnamed protein product [Triticum turgidum subsp. durum]|uniref:Glutamine amidotransferase domain-containing protein n=1 Tax=Triticum turgidum subsp. durum TaxID=4567 RepID=A0A9R0W3R6_TRITD|nr:unnamed protein product [Triticum turgidum subsp. durum]
MGMGPLENAAAVVEGGVAAPVVPVVTAAAAGGGSYALLQCGEDSAYVRDAYGGYFEVFRALLAEDGERWQVYLAAGKRVLGVCFGHQILCRALGGKTGRSCKGWDIGVSCIHPTAAAARLFAPLKMPVHLPIIEFHQDEVWELPPHAEVLARSDKTGVEMFRLGDRAMGVQGHPEYSKDILMSIADRLLRQNLLLDCQVDVAKASFDVRQPDKEFWKKVCRGFLKGRLQPQQQKQQPPQQHKLQL